MSVHFVVLTEKLCPKTLGNETTLFFKPFLGFTCFPGTRGFSGIRYFLGIAKELSPPTKPITIFT